MRDAHSSCVHVSDVYGVSPRRRNSSVNQTCATKEVVSLCENRMLRPGYIMISLKDSTRFSHSVIEEVVIVKLMLYLANNVDRYVVPYVHLRIYG